MCKKFSEGTALISACPTQVPIIDKLRDKTVTFTNVFNNNRALNPSFCPTNLGIILPTNGPATR